MPERDAPEGAPRPGGAWGDGSRQQGRVLVAVAHGSADPSAAATTGELMAVAAGRARVRGLSPPDVRIAYLGHAAPSLPQVMSTIEAGAQVTVLPLLLTAAYHSKTDIPRLLARVGAGSRVTYGEPLGPHPLLLRALERRLPEAALDNPAEVGVVLAASGSSDPEANATVARLAARWQARTGWYAVRAAYASPAATGGQGSTVRLTPAQAVTELLGSGAQRVVVASYLLAPGLFADRIRDASLAAGAAAVAPVLGALPEVADVVLDRYQEAGTRGRAAA